MAAMDILGGQQKQDAIEHVFMWEPAVPNTALSNDMSRDISPAGNGKFVHAYLAAKQITVLYSQHDDILKYPYSMANYSGRSPKQLIWNITAALRGNLAMPIGMK